MLAWILFSTGMVLIVAGIVFAIRRRSPHANGVIALGNLGFMGYHALTENIALMAFHFALACVNVFFWALLALREERS